jgi:hypothetical protein
MQISFDCPKCLKLNHAELPEFHRNVICDGCGWNRSVGNGELTGEIPRQCLICGCQDLWRQKDFNQKLGVLIVGVGILLSTIAVAYMMPGAAMLILMAFGLADWVLYAVLPDRLVCYRCHAQYHRVPKSSASDAFDLEVNERYRQEAIRLKQAGQSANH